MDKELRNKIIESVSRVLDESNNIGIDYRDRDTILRSIEGVIGKRDMDETKINDLSFSNFIELVYLISRTVFAREHNISFRPHIHGETNADIGEV